MHKGTTKYNLYRSKDEKQDHIQFKSIIIESFPRRRSSLPIEEKVEVYDRERPNIYSNWNCLLHRQDSPQPMVLKRVEG